MRVRGRAGVLQAAQTVEQDTSCRENVVGSRGGAGYWGHDPGAPRAREQGGSAVWAATAVVAVKYCQMKPLGF